MKELDRFRGCLIGGAVGDALGYAVEFIRIDEIKRRYGEKGIESYELSHNSALISDDTQMTLFTAEGILHAFTRGNMRGIMGPLESYVHLAYLNWLKTQDVDLVFEIAPPQSWLAKTEELNQRRAPGNTCLSALMSGKMGTVEEPINSSKGCGSVMRVAPIGLYFPPNQNVFELGMKTGVITHGSPSGYLSAGLLALIISKIVYEENKDLEQIVRESLTSLEQYKDHLELKEIVEKAVDLVHQNVEDLAAIEELGEGWVADEALAIAIYSSLKYKDDFKKAVVCAVNHSGDSDSTGAITGNILGAFLGLDAIPKEYLEHLELSDVILEISEDLHRDIPVGEYKDNSSEECKKWLDKYVYGTYTIEGKGDTKWSNIKTKKN